MDGSFNVFAYLLPVITKCLRVLFCKKGVVIEIFPCDSLVRLNANGYQLCTRPDNAKEGGKKS